MRNLSLIIAIVGIGTLLGFLMAKPLKLYGNSLDSFINGEKIFFEGIVDEVKELHSGSLITIKDIKIFCECHNIDVGEQIRIEGIIENFDGNLRVKALVVNIIK